MSLKASLVKIAIKLTPNILIEWVANIVLKGIAELMDFNFDLETRKAYVQVQLVGESETIEVWLEGFGVISEEDSHHLIIHQAHSNRIWLDNLLSRLVGKAWKIPAVPQADLVIELLKENSPEQENTE